MHVSFAISVYVFKTINQKIKSLDVLPDTDKIDRKKRDKGKLHTSDAKTSWAPLKNLERVR